ncbi:MAG: FMN-binding negative transcriptional regulator [Bernardetiaceae bacterium]|jgi:transcriptional regulator|nr:FMN-binding negative transcriptional regulator [Bernardetiaceae bacterium]
MYTPKYFQNHDWAQVSKFIEENGFGILVSHDVAQSQPVATHLPLFLRAIGPEEWELEGHVARANPQWRAWADGSTGLAIFPGPHAYISSSWYNHENVPTWNYLAVHVYGTLHLVQEPAALRQMLGRMVDKYEAGNPQPVSVAGLTPQFYEREVRGLVGFRLAITQVQATYKLSQNRDAENHRLVTEQLAAQGDAQAAAVAELMRQHGHQ